MSKRAVEAIKAGIVGGGVGLIMSFLVNYFVLPQPDTLFAIAAGNGISGGISGFMGGFMGLFMYLRSGSG
ncbi:MAG: hypothetical protein AAFY29_23805 [Pseudomonadota bacterium]